MTVDDIPACVAVLRDHEPSHDVEEWTARFGRDVDGPDKHPVVAEDSGVIVGYARLLRFDAEPDAPANAAPDGYYLSGLIVPVEHRRRGIGTQLTVARLRWLEGRADEAFFYTMHDNVASQRMHEHLGFERVTDDFWFPGMGSGHGEILYSIRLPRVTAQAVSTPSP
jgi:ribosomal protein S18 acetylase RimI-like enzyme